MSWVTLMGPDHHGKMHPEPRDFELAGHVNKGEYSPKLQSLYFKAPSLSLYKGCPSN
jgi:hypothetical protein